MTLAGRIALVTGSSRGIGLAVADALQAAGAHVIRLARSLKDATSERRTDFACDLTDARAVERVVQRFLAKPGLPDIVVNNAGMFVVKPLEATGAQEFATMLATNLTGPFLLLHLLLPALKERHRGHIVTIGSVADRVAFSGNSAYSASKFGLRGLHEVLAVELRGTGVKTTLVAPGPVDTPIWDDMTPFTPREDMLRAEDVAAAVLYTVTQPEQVMVTEVRLMPAGYRPRT